MGEEKNYERCGFCGIICDKTRREQVEYNSELHKTLRTVDRIVGLPLTTCPACAIYLSKEAKQW